MHAVPLRLASACVRRTQVAGAVVSGLHTTCLGAPRCGAVLVCCHSTTGLQEPSVNSTKSEDRKLTQDASAPSSTKPADAPPTASTQGVAAAGSESDSSAPATAAPFTTTAATSSSSCAASSAAPPPPPASTAADGVGPTNTSGSAVTTPEPEPVRWVQPTYQDPDSLPIVDEKGEYVVSRVDWPTGEIAYRTPAPVDDKLAPRFGYNVVQVRKHVSWWKYNQKYPRLSLAYINIQVLFLLGLAWLVAFLTTEYRNTTEAMRTPGAMVGEHRGKGPATNQTQKVTFEKDEMAALMDKAQNNWFDGKAEASYVGSKEYKMKKIPRPKEFSAEDFRKR